MRQNKLRAKLFPKRHDRHSAHASANEPSDLQLVRDAGLHSFPTNLWFQAYDIIGVVCFRMQFLGHGFQGEVLWKFVI